MPDPGQGQHFDRRVEGVAGQLGPRRGDRDLDAKMAQRARELAHVHGSAFVSEHRDTMVAGKVEDPHQATARSDLGSDA